jgi:hypothetical protein
MAAWTASRRDDSGDGCNSRNSHNSRHAASNASLKRALSLAWPSPLSRLSSTQPIAHDSRDSSGPRPYTPTTPAGTPCRIPPWIPPTALPPARSSRPPTTFHSYPVHQHRPAMTRETLIAATIHAADESDSVVPTSAEAWVATRITRHHPHEPTFGLPPASPASPSRMQRISSNSYHSSPCVASSTSRHTRLASHVLQP